MEPFGGCAEGYGITEMVEDGQYRLARLREVPRRDLALGIYTLE